MGNDYSKSHLIELNGDMKRLNSEHVYYNFLAIDQLRTKILKLPKNQRTFSDENLWELGIETHLKLIQNCCQ